MNRKQKRTVSQGARRESNDDSTASSTRAGTDATIAAGLDAVGEATRRAILDILRRHPASVAELSAQLPVSRPAVSQHLKILRGARLVRVEARGTRRIYSLDPDGTAELRRYVDRLWDAALGTLDESVNRKRGARR